MTMKRILAFMLLLSFLLLTLISCGGKGGETAHPGGTTNNESNPNNPYREYSEILQNVLTDNYYNNLISQAEQDSSIAYMKNNFRALPFEFLKDEGFDVNKIRNDELTCFGTPITIGNDLYLALEVETKSAQNYYTTYILRYDVTNQEIEELKSVFASLSNYQISTYYQAPFYIQELDKLKEPEVISKSYIAVDAHKTCYEDISKANYFNTKSGYTTPWHMDTQPENDYYKQTFFLSSSTSNSKYSTIDLCKIGIIELATNRNNLETIDGKKIYTAKNVDVTKYFLDADKENFEKTIKTGYVYITSNCNHVDYKDKLTNNK